MPIRFINAANSDFERFDFEKILTHFTPLISSCIPLKQQNNSWFSCVFRGYRKRPVTWTKLSGWNFTGSYSEEFNSTSLSTIRYGLPETSLIVPNSSHFARNYFWDFMNEFLQGLFLWLKIPIDCYTAECHKVVAFL